MGLQNVFDAIASFQKEPIAIKHVRLDFAEFKPVDSETKIQVGQRILQQDCVVSSNFDEDHWNKNLVLLYHENCLLNTLARDDSVQRK